MDKPYLIGLSGKIHSGKSTVAKALAERHGFVVRGFADALKQDVEGMGFEREVVRYSKPPAVRSLLQAYGQAKRLFNEHYWIERLENAISLCKPGTVFVIDDLRFPNEFEWIKSKDGVCIRIERPDYPVQSNDYSETALDNVHTFDHTVYGACGAVDDLIEHVEDCLWFETTKHRWRED